MDNMNNMCHDKSDVFGVHEQLYGSQCIIQHRCINNIQLKLACYTLYMVP